MTDQDKIRRGRLLKPDLAKQNCGYDSCPFIKGFYLRYTAEKEFDYMAKAMRAMYKSGENFCKYLKKRGIK